MEKAATSERRCAALQEGEEAGHTRRCVSGGALQLVERAPACMGPRATTHSVMIASECAM